MPRHTELIIGAHIAGAATFVLAGAFFIQAWRQRKKEIEYLLAGLMTVALAVFASGGAVAYRFAANGSARALRLQSNLNVAAAIVGFALAVHYALRVGRSAYERRVMRVVYAATLGFELLAAADLWWSNITTSVDDVYGLQLLIIHLSVTPAAMLFHVAAPLGLVFVGYELTAAWRRGRRDILPSAIGSVPLAVTTLNDSLGLGAGLFRTVSLLPLGFFFFIFGVSLTLVSRYGRMSAQLERRTEQLEQKRAALAESLAELKRTQRELVRREQLAMVGELAAVIAHEVRNPMAIVGNAVSSLRGGKVNEGDRQQLLAIIDEEMQRLERLVSDLLSYARPVLPQLAPVDLAELARHSLAVAARDGLEAEVRSVNGARVTADGDLLRLAFENIVTNAVQAMSGGGALTVHIEPKTLGDCHAMAVRFVDSGEGMGDAELKQAMAPFFTTRPTGTGLGLPICDRIVEAHGGVLRIDSKLGEGTTVTMLLPVSPEDELPRDSTRRASLTTLP